MQPTSDFIEGIGYIGGLLTTVAFVPQLIKTWRSQSADDLSLAMLIVFTGGIALWLVYGLAHASWPLVLSNAITLALTGLLLMFKVRDMTARLRADSEFRASAGVKAGSAVTPGA